MPNQNFCKPRDDMSLVNCDLTKTYKTCEPSEKVSGIYNLRFYCTN